MATLAPLLLLFFLAACATAQRHAGLPPPPADPFADPQHDYLNPLRYIANNTLTAISVSLVLAVGLVQTAFVIRYKTRWMLAMTIGCYTFTLGLAMRFGLHSNPRSHGIYIVEYLFVVLSPCAFIAAEYVLLGRLARFLNADQHLLVRPERITKVFIASDLITFLIQAAGGGISASGKDVTTVNIGSKVFLVGLILQLLSFIAFLYVFAMFIARVRSQEHATWTAPGWKVLLFAMALSFIGVVVRSVFRVVELSEGFAGHLATNETLFYTLDTLPLFIAIAVYVPFWPGRFIRSPDARIKLRGSEHEMEQPSENGSHDPVPV